MSFRGYERVRNRIFKAAAKLILMFLFIVIGVFFLSSALPAKSRIPDFLTPSNFSMKLYEIRDETQICGFRPKINKISGLRVGGCSNLNFVFNQHPLKAASIGRMPHFSVREDGVLIQLLVDNEELIVCTLLAHTVNGKEVLEGNCLSVEDILKLDPQITTQWRLEPGTESEDGKEKSL